MSDCVPTSIFTISCVKNYLFIPYIFLDIIISKHGHFWCDKIGALQMLTIKEFVYASTSDVDKKGAFSALF